MCVCVGGGGGGGGGGQGVQGVWLKCLILFLFLHYKTIQIRWKIYISVTLSCNFGWV